MMDKGHWKNIKRFRPSESISMCPYCVWAGVSSHIDYIYVARLKNKDFNGNITRQNMWYHVYDEVTYE